MFRWLARLLRRPRAMTGFLGTLTAEQRDRFFAFKQVRRDLIDAAMAEQEKRGHKPNPRIAAMRQAYLEAKDGK